jgi:ADP-ribose pyrophosphatase
MKDHGPWKIKSSEVKYKSPFVEVREDQVIRPDGKDTIFNVTTVRPGISVLPMDEDGFVYLVEEFRYAIGKYDVGTVCGAIDDGEEALETAKRELKEEIGVTAKEWIPLGRVDPFTMGIWGPFWIYLARGLSFGNPTPEDSEQIKLTKVSFEEAIAMAMDARITGSFAVTNILKAAHYLKKL